jgi:hypothetical protein
MKSIEPEDLSYLADEVERHTNDCHEQFEIITGVLSKLEVEGEYQLWKPDLQFLANAFQSMADATDENDAEPVDYIPNLRAALGRKYMRAVGRA